MHIAGLPNSTNSTLIFSPVGANIVWGIESTDQGISNPKFVRTTNGGENWNIAEVSIPSGHVVRSIHAINANIALIAVDDPTGSNSGIYKTTNSGSTWTKHSFAFQGTGRHPVQIYFFDDNNGLSVGNPSNGYWEIYTTVDGGGNWTRVPQINIPPNAVDDRTFNTTSAAVGNSYWFGTCARDLFRTTDKGLTWSVTQNAFYESADFCGVDIAFKDPLNGIAVTRMGVGEVNRAYQTIDGGETWVSLPDPPAVPSFKFLNYVSGDIYLAVSHATVGYPVDPGSAYTLDGGYTWDTLDNLIHGPASSKSGWSWSGGINDIVYKISFNEFISPWVTQLADGLSNSSNPQIVFSPVDDNICWGINWDNSQFIKTTNGGANWTVSIVTGAAGLICSGISTFDASTAWIAMNDPSSVTSGGIFKTTDGGINWVKQTTAFQGSGGHPNIIHFFDIENGLCVGNPNGGYWEIYTTTDGGSDWIRVSSGNIPAPLPGESGIEHRNVNSVGNIFWFKTFADSPRLYKTTDHGYTWTVADSVIGWGGYSFAFKDSLNGLACDFYPEDKLSRTTDGGLTWHPINPLPQGLSGLSLNYIAYAKGTNGSYVITAPNFVGPNPADPGTAYTTDDGETWTQVSNLPSGPAVFSSYNTGWCGSINDSVYKWDSEILITSVEEFVTKVDNFILSQNYPNPFNPSTTIRYSIPTSEFVTIKVYDVLGNEIATLVNEDKPAGSYEVNFNAAKLSSGIYFYSLQAGSFTQTKKLILIK
jgi:photosystem II stability/assembly factor-like uncharacterized protein